MSDKADNVVLRVQNKLTGAWQDFHQSEYTFIVWDSFGRYEYPMREILLEPAAHRDREWEAK
jgi:hypothetical protein